MPTPDELKTAYAASQPEPKRSLLDNLRRKTTSPAQLVRAPDVLTKLQLASSKLEMLQGQLGDATLDAMLNVDGADQRLAVMETDIAATRAEVAKLKAAHNAALARDENAMLQQRASLYRAQLATVRRKLEARDIAAQEFTDAFVIVAEKWKVMIETGKAAFAATPIGTKWPDDGSPNGPADFDGIKRLVAHEIWRLAGDAKLGNRQSFPGGTPDDINNACQPDKITPLAETMKKHTAFVLTKLTGKAPG